MKERLEKLQAELQTNPSSEASKKAGRTAGVFFFIMGIALVGINYYTWMVQGRVWKLLLASMITVKMPTKKH